MDTRVLCCLLALLVLARPPMPADAALIGSGDPGELAAPLLESLGMPRAVESGLAPQAADFQVAAGMGWVSPARRQRPPTIAADLHAYLPARSAASHVYRRTAETERLLAHTDLAKDAIADLRWRKGVFITEAVNELLGERERRFSQEFEWSIQNLRKNRRAHSGLISALVVVGLIAVAMGMEVKRRTQLAE